MSRWRAILVAGALFGAPDAPGPDPAQQVQYIAFDETVIVGYAPHVDSLEFEPLVIRGERRAVTVAAR